MPAFAVLVAVVLGVGWAQEARAEAPVDYTRDVKPLLARHCVDCHGEKLPRGKLRLDTAAAAFKGGKSGPPIVPGKADESALIDAVTGEGSIDRMPLKRPPLSPAEIATLRTWIDQGAKAPAVESPSKPTTVHWAFVPPTRKAIPAVADPNGAAHPIDAFIRSRLDQEKISPSPPADRATLIRRVSLDLVGLPPTPEERAAFVADDRPDAYERLVDRLLGSPHYGERWARIWLDQARYADSNGYSIDAPRKIWKYRDWVIDAFNGDLPFDQFVIDQIAGDLLPGATLNETVATGFHRNTPINQEGGIDLEQFRVEAVEDRVATTGSVFLGLTVGCAQCHDHKYDPISQREYYRLLAFFNSVDEPEIDLAEPSELARRDALRVQIAAFHKELKAQHPQVASKEMDWEKTLSPLYKQELPPELKDAFDRAVEKRTKRQWEGLTELFLAQSADFKTQFAALAALQAQEPKIETSMVVQERPTPRPTFVFVGGDFTRQGEPVSPGIPSILPPIAPRNPGRADRLDFARWLVAPGHPLTARVALNRVWQVYFGRGIVETENDFGTQGTPPSHLDLLDWLATEFPARGWSLKAMHRLIVTSRTYRQSSHARGDLERVDPGNRLLARQSRLRLDAEVIRDESLAVSGLLSPKVGGPSVFPPQPDGVMTLGQMRRPWVASRGADRYRRGLYTYFWRATPFPALTVFDAPNAAQTCSRRNRSNTPLQALTLLNDEAFVECAEALAGRVRREGGESDQGRLDHAFRLGLGRSPTGRERALLLSLLADERRASSGGSADRDAWTTAARVLLNLDEFITRE